MKYQAVNSPVSWLGGKRLLRKKITALFPEHRCFVEAFAGGAWVSFYKAPSKVEVINDRDDELINFYNVVKVCPQELVAALQYDLVSRCMFEQYRIDLDQSRHANPEKQLSNVERATRFYYTLKASFGSQRQHFGVTTTSKPKLNLAKVNEIIMKAHVRLAQVIIENRDYRDIIRIYDRPHTLFYLDPPYRCPASKVYFAHMKDSDYKTLKDLLKSIKGKFILSINDDSFIRALFDNFYINDIETVYSTNKSSSKRVNELLISNFELDMKVTRE